MSKLLRMILSFQICYATLAGQYHYSEWDWQEKMAEEGWVDLSEAVKEEIEGFQQHQPEDEIDVIICNRSEESIKTCSISVSDTTFHISTPVNSRTIWVFRHPLSWEKAIDNHRIVVTVHTERKNYTSHLVDPLSLQMHNHSLFFDLDSTGIHLSFRGSLGECSLGRMHFPADVKFGRMPSFSNLELDHKMVVRELASIGNRLPLDVRTNIEGMPSRKAKTQASVMMYDGNLSREEQDKFLFLLYHAAKSNDPRAIYLLGCCLFTGYGCTKDVQAAYNFFQEATMVPFHYDAEFMLGYCYEKGIAVPVNVDEAKRHYWLSMKALGRLAALRFAYLCFTTEPKDRLLAMDALLSALGRQWPAEPILHGLQKQYPNGIPFDE